MTTDHTPPADRAALRDRIAEALYAHDHPSHLVPLNQTGMGPAYRESANAVLAVLPPPVSRADVYAEVAERLAADAEQGDKEGFTRIYRRSAARKVREWADELRRLADEAQPGTEARPSAWGVCPDCGAAAGPDCDCPPFGEQRGQAHAEGEHAFCGDECETAS